jgi:TAT (twin-arginine translocation) pathway signal sequence
MASSSRRDFLKIGVAGAAAGLAAACTSAAPAATAPAQPAPATAVATPGASEPASNTVASTTAPPAPTPAPTAKSQRTLVVVQLSGGHDGLNAVVPYGNGMYYQLRPQIGIAANQVLHLTDQVGLHPNLKSFKTLYDNQQLAII